MFYDNNQFLVFFLAFFICILLYNNPYLHSYLINAINHYELNPKMKSIQEWILKKNEYIIEEVVVKKSLKEKEDFLENFELTRKKKRNIYKKYKRLQ